MDDSKVLQRAVPAQRAGGPTLDLVVSKLRRPHTRAGTVRRSSLIDRLTRDDCGPIVSVVAPAGYGKTTLLSQWAERDGRAFAWVSVDERDNDPKVLLRYVAEALDAVQPVDGAVFDALASPGSSVRGSVVPRLGSAFAAMTTPVVLVLDDVHLLRNFECRAALSVLAGHVPDGSRLALAGRDEPPLRVARLRAEGRITEIGPLDLSLTRSEAGALMRAAEVALDEDDVAELHRRTEGWAAGLCLAASHLQEGGALPRAVASFGGRDRPVREYVESQFLERISRKQREFLTRTAVLERLSGPLCEAVLGITGAGATLAHLARLNLLLVPLDRRGRWYRYHHLFRAVLLAELERREPGLIPVLQRRAAEWCLRNGLPEVALEYHMAAGDADETARLVQELWLPAYRQARVTTILGWLRWLEDRGKVEGHPMLVVLAALLSVATGRPDQAERWADAADRWQYGNVTRTGDPAAEAWAAVLRALMCRRGVERMRADADEAEQRFAAAGIVAPVTGLLQGIARVLSGDPDGADASFEDAIRTGEKVTPPEILAGLLSERSLLAMAHRDWDQADALARQAGTVSHQTETKNALACAVQARVAVHRGDIASARRQLVGAQRARRLLTYAQPHLAVQARLELTRVHVALADLAGARTLMREIAEILRRRPGLGTLVGEADALRARLAHERGSSIPRASALTTAELRLLPLLATHLPVPEVAAGLFLSPNTIKSQMASIYRKLGASSRHQAVARARELGLLED